MELSPIYEALKRCLYPTIGPLIYTNYRGFNARMHEEREREGGIELQTRVTGIHTIVRIPRNSRNIRAPDCSLIDTLSTFSRSTGLRRGKLSDSVRINPVIRPFNDIIRFGLLGDNCTVIN